MNCWRNISGKALKTEVFGCSFKYDILLSYSMWYDLPMKNELIENIDRLHTTPMGVDRIRRNLSLDDKIKDVVEWCRHALLSSEAEIFRQGKNWYIKSKGCIITVNADSYTIITAHVEKN